jgi:hypothetical protein
VTTVEISAPPAPAPTPEPVVDRRVAPHRLVYGFLAALAVAALAVPPGHRWAPVDLAVWLALPGAALAGWWCRRQPLTEIFLSVVLSASVGVLVGELALAVHYWHPDATARLLAALSLPCLVHHALRSRPVPADPVSRVSRVTRAARVGRAARRADLAVVAVIGTSLALWALAMWRTDLGRLGDTGLVSVAPATYWASLVVLTAGFFWSLRRGPGRPWHRPAYVVTFVWLLYGVVPVLSAEPRYGYVFRHVGVAAYLDAHGSVNRAVDIYQNWPGFFALMAQITHTTGIGGLAQARWGQLAFALLDAMAVRYVVRGLTADYRRVWASVWLYLVADWVGQNYLSPQAFGFVGTLAVVGLVLHNLAPTRPARPGRLGRPVAVVADRLAGRPTVAVPAPPAEGPALPTSAAVALALVVSAAVVVSHQLSPYVLVLFLLAAVVTRRCRTWWLPLAVLAMAGGWLWLGHTYVMAHFNLFGGIGNVTANAAGSSTSGGSPGHLLVLRAARVLSFAVWAGGAPLPLVLAQSYGGEAIYRVFLFSAPFSAYLLAGVLTAARHRIGRPAWSGRRAAAAGAVALALTLLWVVAFYGLLRSDLVSPGEVSVDAWFAAHAPPGAVLGVVCCDFPDIYSAHYDRYETPLGTFGADIVDSPAMSGRRLSAADIPRAIRALRASYAWPIYVAVSPSQEAYAEAFGLAPPGSVANFGRLLIADRRQFKVVDRAGDTVLLELRAHPLAPRSRSTPSRSTPSRSTSSPSTPSPSTSSPSAPSPPGSSPSTSAPSTSAPPGSSPSTSAPPRSSPSTSSPPASNPPSSPPPTSPPTSTTTQSSPSPPAPTLPVPTLPVPTLPPVLGHPAPAPPAGRGGTT